MARFKITDNDAADRVAHFVEEQIAKALNEPIRTDIEEPKDLDNLMEWEIAVARVEAYDECYELLRKTKIAGILISCETEMYGHEVQAELSLALNQIIEMIKKERK